MKRPAIAARGARALRIFVLTVAAVWTLALAASLLWGAAAVRRDTFERALPRGRLAAAAAPPASAGDSRALEAALARYDRLIAAGHVALWVTGLGFVGAGGRWLLRIDREREEAVASLMRERETLRLTQAELERQAANLAEANRLKDLFTDVLSHDLLNPATASRYFVERLREGEADPARLRLIEAVDANLHRLTEMVRNASLYSRLEESRESPVQIVDLAEVVRGVLLDLEPQLGAARVSVKGPAPGQYFACVHPMFANVVANLVTNAAKYAASGRRIAVGIEGDGAQWVLSVRDWGAGIAAAAKERLFTRFERLGKEEVQGNGLGLAISRRLVELHGGSIWVEDNPEGGSVFRVRVHGAGPGDGLIRLPVPPRPIPLRAS